ncbi:MULTISPECIES: cytosolic protein [unclassified Bacillus (in: firmicutes)]|uniref:cytosolic protein n=1 Tax=unclassified Bacillus (in: firmicutes) TaxID=185979 RepID=UPI001BE5EC07|nr:MULTISPECIES: cytosolic protein [unclassified Bacillus (in: firmicutes)]MBT2617112.1 cytosolic protein [Bacillus sp. ISL-78]MBT2629039.1 cytosolic protein [Bacillus sp. ISL-101]MBT2717458.1 cytosolic protein [Bacillus sp. ISL-57]
MNTFIVGFHQEDNVDSMQVQKLTSAEFEKATSRGFRRLFELDTNIGYFVFFDAEDDEGDLSHLVLQYEEDNQDPSDCYSFTKNDFYEFMALYLQGMDEVEVEDDEDDDNEEYGPIHHLAHLMFHIVEEGKSVKP